MKRILALVLAFMLLCSVPLAAMAEIVRGGTLTAAKTSTWSNLNPTKTNARADDRYVVGQIYEPLIDIDENGNFVPQLATGWTVSDEKIVLTLRDDVTFHDGTKFNAEAVKYVLDWYLSDACGHVYRSEIAEIASIDVVDEYTVQLNLSAPSAAIIGALSNVAGYMISPAAIEKYGEELSMNTAGTGPFMVKEVVTGDHITLVRNENYYELGEDGQPLPYLDEVVIKIVGDDSVKTTNLLTGDVDIVDWNNSSTSTLSLKAAEGIETVETAATDIYAMVINAGDKQLSDVRVRQAVAYAINREEAVLAMTDGLGNVAAFLNTPNQWFYSDYTPYTHDVEKAKALLAEAGYPNGIDLTLRYISREPDNTLAQVMQAQMKAAGINLKIEAMERLAWVELHHTNQGGELGFAKVASPRVDPYQQYTQLTGYVTRNCAAYDEYGAELVDILNQSKKLSDMEERKALLAEFQQKDLDNCANIFVYANPRYTSWNAKVQGVELESDGTWNLKAAYLAK